MKIRTLFLLGLTYFVSTVTFAKEDFQAFSPNTSFSPLNSEEMHSIVGNSAGVIEAIIHAAAKNPHSDRSIVRFWDDYIKFHTAESPHMLFNSVEHFVSPQKERFLPSNELAKKLLRKLNERGIGPDLSELRHQLITRHVPAKEINELLGTFERSQVQAHIAQSAVSRPVTPWTPKPAPAAAWTPQPLVTTR